MSKLLTAIRSKTLAVHEELEQSLRLFERCPTREDYRDVLKKFYGFYHPLGEQISNRQFTESHLKLRTEWLSKDLLELGLSQAMLSEIAPCDDLPDYPDELELLGFRYVLEGSTLGGQVIKKHFKDLWHQQDDKGLAFFGAYASDTGPRWRAFLQEIDQRSADMTDVQQDKVVEGAMKTFQKLMSWMK